MTRPFRFGYQTFAPKSAEQWRDMARKCEDYGYSTLSLADHYLGDGPATAAANHPPQTVAAVPAMMAAAGVTSTLTIGCRVFCCDYHHPFVLLKEMGTIDLLSDGRLEAGFGAGWVKSEYEALGIPMERPGKRIDRMVEYVELARLFFEGGPIDYQGEYAHVTGTDGMGSPQAGGPSIMIGGGSPRVLGLAGQLADIVSINFDNSDGKIGAHGLASGTPDGTDEKLDWIRAGAGDRFDELEIEIGAYFTVVTDDTEAALENLGPSMGMSPEELANYPHGLIGSVDQICETLLERRERYGISYVTVGRHALDAFAPVVAKLSGT
ncbi:MAG: TIGR03621 family F420-dependent LLM class oxidoreductase [Acidimicrobiales bacterium]